MENSFRRRTLGDILKGDERIEVPKHQRSFVWGKDEASNLIQDIEESEKGSFLGTVVFHKAKDDDDFVEVVDGQQRLTSVFILLSALRRRCQDLGRHDLAERIQDKIAHVNESTAKNEGSKIKVSTVIEYTFNKTIVEREWNGDFTIDVLKNKKREVKKIKPLYDEFWGYVETLDNSNLEVFLGKLYGCYFGEIIIKDISKAFEIFERMNARGIELNAADLLKNHLFSELYDSEINVEEIWKTISENAPGLLRMLRYYHISRQGYISNKDLFKGLKVYSTEIGPKTLLGDIEDFSRLYSVLYEPRADALEEVLEHYNLVDVLNSGSRAKSLLRTFKALKLFRVTQVYPLIMSLLHSFINESDRDEKDLKKLFRVLKNIENFLFINHEIVGNPGNKVEKDFAFLASETYKNGSFEEDCNRINSYLKENLEEQEQFQLSFSGISYENLNSVYYLFDRFTNKSQKGEEIIEIFDTDTIITKGNYNIEHLKPQSERTDENSDYIDNIGNLLIISRHTNSKLGNKSFAEKMQMLKGRQTKLVIVDDFIREYGDQKEWTEEDIQNRATKMGIDAYTEVWKLH